MINVISTILATVFIAGLLILPGLVVAKLYSMFRYHAPRGLLYHGSHTRKKGRHE